VTRGQGDAATELPPARWVLLAVHIAATERSSCLKRTKSTYDVCHIPSGNLWFQSPIPLADQRGRGGAAGRAVRAGGAGAAARRAVRAVRPGGRCGQALGAGRVVRRPPPAGCRCQPTAGPGPAFAATSDARRGSASRARLPGLPLPPRLALAGRLAAGRPGLPPAPRPAASRPGLPLAARPAAGAPTPGSGIRPVRPALPGRRLRASPNLRGGVRFCRADRRYMAMRAGSGPSTSGPEPATQYQPCACQNTHASHGVP
jgi:hypothetical protein